MGSGRERILRNNYHTATKTQKVDSAYLLHIFLTGDLMSAATADNTPLNHIDATATTICGPTLKVVHHLKRNLTEESHY